MSLFYRTPEPNFAGLFRLIDDCYAHQSGANGNYNQGQRQVARHVPTFTPKFDLKETESNYELHGELPGIDKKDVQIEFTDPQTIVVRGRVERSYTSGTPPAEMSGALTEGGDDTVVVNREDDQHEAKSHQPTVEDEKEAGKAAGETTVEKKQQQQQQQQPAKPQAKYWVSERSVGEFSRSFAFPTRVEHDGVTANLNNGILTVIVPKAKKLESRRIAIN
ncbi:HSP20-like chaperone [Biscogniauxia mediterranea]|nr:HSP20-like chaperone [Biscogniauxia mediterranea]